MHEKMTNQSQISENQRRLGIDLLLSTVSDKLNNLIQILAECLKENENKPLVNVDRGEKELPNPD